MAKQSNSTALFQLFRKEITSGNPKPVYFFCGEESFYVDALQDCIIELMPADMRDFNLDVLYGTEHSLDKVLGIARSYPMMSDRRIVILRDFSAVFDPRNKSTNVDSENPDEEDESNSTASVELLINYLNKPNPSAILVMIDKKAPSGNTKLGRAVTKKEHVGFGSFDPIPEERLPEWIVEWAKVTHKRVIEPRAAQVMARLTGSDLLLVSTELDKLFTFKNNDESISEDDVRKLVTVAREYSVFELKEALFSKNIANTLTIAEQILHTSKSTDVGEVIRIVSFFYSVFSNIWQIQRLTQKGIPSKQIQTTVGVKSDFYFRNLTKDSKAFPANQMPLIFEALLDADRSVKGMSKLEAKDILFLLLRRIIG
ncbi:MAG: DNA polymerase III subunit delta [Balneolales bacterium]|nr:DNA polymerase III subunit delta [Balneolales bacterium]